MLLKGKKLGNRRPHNNAERTLRAALRRSFCFRLFFRVRPITDRDGDYITQHLAARYSKEKRPNRVHQKVGLALLLLFFRCSIAPSLAPAALVWVNKGKKSSRWPGSPSIIHVQQSRSTFTWYLRGVFAIFTFWVMVPRTTSYIRHHMWYIHVVSYTGNVHYSFGTWNWTRMPKAWLSLMGQFLPLGKNVGSSKSADPNDKFFQESH